ncbi:hypothetical protein [uncultured Proteiniphilum sp.]|uniref:hypothetical protein n=1 Tax=uncultured Proteiniphilum sp. TaxID=497637 RepID=UPI00260E1E75|nr:hypothetical protein [uncultured Proteiniphilum sp.]
MKKLFFIAILLAQWTVSYSQDKVSIYESGEPVRDYETNFKNLINNWTPKNVTNAGEYDLLECSFVETLDDSTRYKFYRNYFSGEEALYSSILGRDGGDSKGKIHELYIRPGYLYAELYDTRGMTPEQKTLLSEDFRKEARNLFESEMDIETMQLNHYYYKYEQIDTIVKSSQGFDISGIERSYKGFEAASPDTISQKYIDYALNEIEDKKELDTTERRKLLLEEILIRKTSSQLFFNEQVGIGDRVYVIKFQYNGRIYNNYVICSAKSKKVVMDYFFKNITL